MGDTACKKVVKLVKTINSVIILFMLKSLFLLLFCKISEKTLKKVVKSMSSVTVAVVQCFRFKNSVIEHISSALFNIFQQIILLKYLVGMERSATFALAFENNGCQERS